MFTIIVLAIIVGVLVTLGIADAIKTRHRWDMRGGKVRPTTSGFEHGSLLTSTRSGEKATAEAHKLIATKYRNRLAEKYGVEASEVREAHVFKEFAELGGNMIEDDRKRALYLMDMLDAESETHNV